MGTTKLSDPSTHLVHDLSSNRHRRVIDGFQAIGEETRNGLAWVVLDTKFERFITAAIAAAINRSAGDRIAHVEFTSRKRRKAGSPKNSRLDLVVLRGRIPSRAGRCLDPSSSEVETRYETKAGQLFDFATGARTQPSYLGGDLNRDLLRLSGAEASGLFFIAEISDPTRCMKYYAGHDATIDAAIAILEGHIECARMVGHESIDCGIVDETAIRLHMLIFDRR